MNWLYIIDNLPKFFDASLITLQLAFWSILFSLFIGIICAIITSYQIRFLNPIVQVYIELSRNTPLLIQLFFLYFGLSKLGIHLDGMTCAILGLTFLGGSYMAEAFRAGIESIHKGQIESALSLGLTSSQTFIYVIFPQAFTVAIPAIGANCLFLIKETSIASAIAIAELMFMAKELIGLDYKTNEALFLLVLFYLIILLPISISIHHLEKRTGYAKYGSR
ncbi:amino acid ABC transporter permease [Avibacterium sp. 21-599]|uniref:amino acid ABC transporter permease n=1 Tax=Avibacterium sp. 21-599 TaxID=2911528 RepID=UPI0022482EAF|nr:amino acid ABC transporter permease [Avibacterium sp. 21-599]MCW9718761.1 amino acid ABC transporter permease [Avibacterium sp. 21-599]